MRIAQRTTPFSAFKNLFVPQGVKPRRVLFGPFSGIRLNLDLTRHSQIRMGLYEAEINGWFSKLSKGIRSAINVGAAEGEQTLYFLMKTPAETVYSYEPSDACRKELLANVGLNGLTGVPRLQLSSKFVGSSNDEKTCTLDAISPMPPSPCLILVDVEEAEMDVLAGAGKLLSGPDTRWIVETHTAELERRCLELFRQAGYKTTIVKNGWWRPLLPELRSRPHNRWLIATKAGLP